MRSSWIVAGLVVSALAASLAIAADAPTRQVRVQSIALASALPKDLVEPEGKSRWYLDAVPLGTASVRTLRESAGVVAVDGGPEGAISYRDTAGSDAAVRWALPDHRDSDLRMGTRLRLDLTEISAGRPSRVRIESEIVGIGWAHLPTGPREVVLQRALVSRSVDGGTVWSPEARMYRWIDPRAGVVVETTTALGGTVTGAPAPQAATPAPSAPSITGGEVVQEVLAGASTLKVYVGQLVNPNYTQLLYGWDKGTGATIASLVPNPGINTVGDLIALNSWDFSGDNAGTEIAQSDTPVNSAETCNYNQCGYTVAGAQFGREDRNFPNPSSLRKDNQVVLQENRANDVTVWVKAGAQNEGKSGIFGSGESRFCYVSDGSHTRNPVPLWQFVHQDTGGWYMTSGDAWSGGPGSSCQQTLFNQTCGSGGFPGILYAKSCGANGSDPAHTGTQNGTVLKGGVVTTPSGHTVNALLIRTVGDFCVYSDSGCILKLDAARTTVYLWQAPNIGTVAFLQSAQNPPDYTSWTTVDSTNMKFGLFPPLSITVTGTTATTVSLSWNPGNDTHRINGYKIYWDTDSGASTPYAFNSDANPGQVSFSGTTATISGLASGTTYYFTVTSKSTYTDPSSNIATTYESILYPTQVSGDPSFVYPVEVQGQTTSSTCIPTTAVTGLTVNKSSGQYQFCWNAATDPCLQGYDVTGADTPNGTYTTVASVDAATTCWTGSPSQTYFLVTIRGTGGNGP